MVDSIPPDAETIIAYELPCLVAGDGCTLDIGGLTCDGCTGDGKRLIGTDIEVEQWESPFVVINRDHPEGPSLVARSDGWFPVEQ